MRFFAFAMLVAFATAAPVLSESSHDASLTSGDYEKRTNIYPCIKLEGEEGENLEKRTIYSCA
ncbi:hypothetical protein N7537_007020 [Penicillium hordei]|uniref:Uncharacterized protein n=1 Tax=Penicillium hordei TaxID=40994 RepID=A0AAD6E8X4_9EURO|nr:uncharacterized protein N7537_007020 [Penicillium hordei]KAJ5604064.1 hypothetical protein N7537_007020 [Penicillium hordei]